jgi:dTDP-glucose pyrophosphorylase
MKDITVKLDITIREAMKKIGKSGKRCLVIVDEKNTLLGTLSDGDVRKAILKGAGFEDSISSVYHQNPMTLTAAGYTLEEAKKLFVREKFDLIPIVDENSTLLDVLFLDSVLNNGDKKKIGESQLVPVVIMAGGRGTRMEPFTKILPKSLVPINEKPMIEHIIERFTEVGCSEFHLTVNYKGKILKAYFEELQPEYNVSFVDEKEPLGTAGSLQYLKGKFNKSFFVTNCDIIIKADYASIYEFHKKGEYDITLVASAKEYIIPYGTCELNENGHLSHIYEKPKYNFLVNTGLYVLNPDILEMIPKNKFYHITNLIEDAKNQGKKVGVFPIDDDDWIDVGQWAEYKNAIDKF